MVLISAMAAVTKTVGFGVSGSTSYLNPYVILSLASDGLPFKRFATEQDLTTLIATYLLALLAVLIT